MIINDLLKKKVLHYFFESVIQQYETKLEKTNDNFEIQTGKKDANFGDSSGEYPFYTCALVPIKSKTYSYDGEYLILPGNGANVGATIYFKGKFEAYQRTYLISSKTGMVDMKYAYYYYLAYWQEYNQHKMYGSAIPYIRLGNLENFEILYPKDISVQKEVATQIDNMFKLIETKEKNDQEKAKLKEVLKEKILDSAIHGTLVKNDINLKPLNINKINSDMPYEIPSNWIWVYLKDISDYGNNKKKNGKDINDDEWILELEDIEKDTGRIIKKVLQKERKAVSVKNIFKENDVLYGKLRPYLNKCVIASECGYCSTEIEPMTLIDSALPKYLHIVLTSKYFSNYVNSCSYGAKMPRLGTKDGQNAMIPLPPLEEQKKIVEKIESLFELIEQL